jgi:hypothetical protein
LTARHNIAAEHRLGAVDRIADREPRPEAVERIALHHREIAARIAFSQAPVGPAGQRRAGRIRRHVEVDAVDAPHHDILAPIIVEIGQQRLHLRHARMDVAVDRTSSWW